MKCGHSEGGHAEPRFLALASRRFHGQNSDHEYEKRGHGLLRAVIKPEFFDTATVRPSRCGIEELWLYDCLARYMARIFTLVVRILAMQTP